MVSRTLVLWWTLVACGPRIPDTKLPPTSEPAQIVSAPPVLASAVPPPAEVGILLSLAAPERDIDRIAELMPSYGATLRELPTSLRAAMGPGLGSEIDLSAPAFVAIGDTEQEIVSFAVALKRGLSATLPPELQLAPKRPGVQSITFREGKEHGWIGSSAACEVHEGARARQVLACAPNQETLDKLGNYVATLGLNESGSLPALSADFFPRFLRALDEVNESELNPATILIKGLIQELGGMRLIAEFAAESLHLTSELRLTALSAPLSRLLVAPSATRRPPEFPGAPAGALFGLTISSLDPHLISMADVALLRAALLGGSADPADKRPKEETTSPVVGGVSLAYGLDLSAARARLEQWVEADAKDPAGAVTPGTFEPVRDWWIIRMEDDHGVRRTLIEEIVKGLQPGSMRLIQLAEKERLPKDTLHLAMGEGEGSHWYIATRRKVLLLAVSKDASTAADVLRWNLGAKKGSPAPGLFREANAPRASALGFMRPEIFAARTLNYDSGFDRRRSLQQLEAVLGPAPAPHHPALIAYEISRPNGGPPTVRWRYSMSTRSLNPWLPLLFEVFDSL
jgi:hypothetical protein